MNTKKNLYLASIFVFSLLFYQQSVGVNYLLFAGLLLCASALTNEGRWKNKQWLLIASGTIVSSFFAMYYANSLAITMSILSVLALMSIQRINRASYLSAISAGSISVIFSVVFMILGRIDASRLGKLRPQKPKTGFKKLMPILLTAIIAVLFISLYRSINPVFDSYFAGIFDSISWGWVFCCFFGAILLYSFFFQPRLLRKGLRFEQRFGKTISPNPDVNNKNMLWGSLFGHGSEKYTAKILFVVLNLLLLALNTTDVHCLFFKGALPEGISYSDYVHNGVGAIIVSIVLSLAVIVIFLRGRINYDADSKNIRLLAYLWLGQNIALVSLAFFKNQMYIEAYSLTYKRIGVYYYLAFCILGLLLAIYKMYAKKDTWFLFRSNSFGIYAVLTLSCAVNWNGLICSYNMSRSETLDNYYLFHQGYQNYPKLWETNFLNENVANGYESRKWFGISFSGEKRYYWLPESLGSFLYEYEKQSLFSYCGAKSSVYHYFEEQVKTGKIPSFTYNEVIKHNSSIQ